MPTCGKVHLHTWLDADQLTMALVNNNDHINKLHGCNAVTGFNTYLFHLSRLFVCPRLSAHYLFIP